MDFLSSMLIWPLHIKFKILFTRFSLLISSCTTTSFDNDFIINEVADRNARAYNLIFYNVIENESNQVEVRITHDLEQVNSCIRSIISEADASEGHSSRALS